MKLESSLPMLIVKQIEDELPLYKDTVQYEVKHEVKDNKGTLTYTALAMSTDKHCIMFVSKAFAERDLPTNVWEHLKAPGASYMYHSVAKLDVDALKNHKAVEYLAGPRNSSYGAIEAFVLDASGHVHCFGEWPKQAT
jgi:hypothetical protein